MSLFIVVVVAVVCGENVSNVWSVSVYLLNVAEGEPWTDGAWTKVAHKIHEKRSFVNNGYDETIDGDGIGIINTMNTDHCEHDSVNEHGRMCYREWRKENQRLDWEIEHID